VLLVGLEFVPAVLQAVPTVVEPEAYS